MEFLNSKIPRHLRNPCSSALCKPHNNTIVSIIIHILYQVAIYSQVKPFTLCAAHFGIEYMICHIEKFILCIF